MWANARPQWKNTYKYMNDTQSIDYSAFRHDVVKYTFFFLENLMKITETRTFQYNEML